MTKLLEGSVKRHLFRLTLPSIAGMLAMMIFNLTDTWFVSRLGTEELAAMGFTFPVVFFVGALATGFSTGSASIISRALGARNRPLARRTVTGGLCLTVIGTLCVSAAGYFSINPLFRMLGAEGRALELVHDYMHVWFIGAGFAILPPVSDACLRAAGDVVRPVLVMCVCAGLNVILDPILIFGFGPIPAMGIEGAAVATVIARGLGALTSLSFLHSRHHLIDWDLPHVRDLLRSWKEIVRLGIPASLTQSLHPIAQAYSIYLAANVGSIHAVAAMATGIRILSFLFIIPLAYNIAIVPFAGQNYGADAHPRVHEARRISIRFALIYSGAVFLFLLPSSRIMAGLFSDVPEVIRMSTQYMLVVALGYPGMQTTMYMSQLLNVIGKPLPVMAINLTRVFVFIMPLAFAGSYLYGFTGLVVSLAIANLLAGVIAFYISRANL